MPNRLADSLSPYLEQHAHNPVDWYPWCDEALTAARTSDRPVLLSIGYSACHWCHVMAHESFDDESIAERMNAWFVNIKVDREERPDLDRIYQLAFQLLTGRGGGWPLTIFLDPTDLTPFAAGTYFPPEARDGLIGFGDLLERIHGAWLNQRDQISAQNRQLVEALSMISARRTEASGEPDRAGQELLGQLESRWDRRHGGFGDAPKFPQAPLLAWLSHRGMDDEGSAAMLGDALDAMSRNGLFDHIGGGFFRYCVDGAWEIPHFEKMLTDSALLLPLYAEASRRWNRSEWAETARRTAAFLIDELQLPDGGFASSFDADSRPAEPEAGEPAEPREGAFYLWTPARLDACLDADDARLARERFGLDGPPNFDGEQWHLVIARSIDELVARADEAESMRERLDRLRERLAACRARRPAPARDEKMRAGPNALAAGGLLRAGRLLGEPAWVECGSLALDRLWERLFEHDPPRAVWREGRSAQAALVDDYGAVLNAILERLSARWDSGWLDRAETVAEAILDRFFDPERGVLYLTPLGHERLPMRPTANLDDAAPSGAGLAARGLLRLGHLTGSAEWLELAGRIIDAAQGDIERMPSGHPSLLIAAADRDDPPAQVLIGGTGTEAEAWHADLLQEPDLLVYRIDDDSETLPGPLGDLAAGSQPTAVVCAGGRCLAPAHDEAELERRLSEARGGINP